MPTARNARGIDIMMYSSDAKRLLTVQVKALSKRVAVPLKMNAIMGDYWVIVSNLASSPRAFVMTPGEVSGRANMSGKDTPSYWLEPRDYDTAEFEERWDRIGYGDTPEQTPGIAATTAPLTS